MVREWLKKKLNLSAKNNPQVYIPFELHSSIGGPSTFLKNLRTYLDKIGFTYTAKINKARVILFPISYDLKALKQFKAKGGIVCQRLDGVYYPEKNGSDYIKRNEKMREVYLNFADHVIFQSQYSKAQCFDMFGEKPSDKYSIIVNGVNTNIFYPNLFREFNKNKIRFCTTGNIRNPDMFVPVVRALDLISEEIKFEFHVIGPVKNDECAALMARSYIIHHGSCDMEKVATLLREMDIFIYSHLNPPCPNSIFEAIASGLPVVGYNSGALAELLPFSIDLLADAGEKLYHQYDDFHPEKLAQKLMQCVSQYERYRVASLQHWDQYSMDNCGKQYVEVLNRLSDRAP